MVDTINQFVKTRTNRIRVIRCIQGSRENAGTQGKISQVVGAVCDRGSSPATRTRGYRPLLSKLAKNRGRVLLPSGEGGPEGRMRAGMPKHFRILTLTRRSAPPSPEGRGTHPYLVHSK